MASFGLLAAGVTDFDFWHTASCGQIVVVDNRALGIGGAIRLKGACCTWNFAPAIQGHGLGNAVVGGVAELGIYSVIGDRDAGAWSTLNAFDGGFAVDQLR